MRRPLSRLTGEWISLPSPAEREAARLARMRHIIWLAVKTMSRMAQEDHARLIMYTLTYRGLKDWKPRHVGGFCRWLRRHGHIGYTWVGELQMRGAVHYHVLALLPIGVKWTKPSASAGGWSHGFTWVTDEIKKPLYIMKYLQKGRKDGQVTRFPKGFRLYAVNRGVVRRMSLDHAISYHLAQLPGWFRQSPIDLCTSLASVRVNGGVSYGGYTHASPYTTRGFADLASLGEQMYNKFVSYR